MFSNEWSLFYFCPCTIEFSNDSLPNVVKVCSGPLTPVSGGDVYEGEVMVVTVGASSVTVVEEGESCAISGPAPLCPRAIELDSVRLLG
ncbi:hypothetical protein Tco_1390617, partial [Tanacetum coccineum]